jgi:hypothetical protein
MRVRWSMFCRRFSDVIGFAKGKAGGDIGGGSRENSMHNAAQARL